MSNESQAKAEKLSDVSSEFKTRIPKALIERVEKQKKEEKTNEAAPLSEEDIVSDSPVSIAPTPPKTSERTVRDNIQNTEIPKDRDLQSNAPLIVAARPPSLRLASMPVQKKPETAPPPPVANLSSQIAARPPSLTRGSQPVRQSPPATRISSAPNPTKISRAPENTVEKINFDPTAKDSIKNHDKASADFASLPKSTKKRSEDLYLEQAASNQNREIRIDLSASRSLTHLICALAVNPGLGSEVDVEDRRGNIQSLIAKSHELTDFICKKIKNDGHVPNYLYGSIFQEATRHVATIWNDQESLDTEAVEKIAAEVFNHENPLLNQFTFDASSQDERYKMDGSERAELELHSALMGAMGNIRTTVLSMRVGKLIEGYGEQVEALREQYAGTPYLFGQEDDSKIVVDLTQIAFRIAEKNKINAIDEGMTTQWNVSMIYRAADLVKSEYEMFVERLVRASFSDLALHEQALNGNNDMYEIGLKNVEKRAEESFNMISKTARRLALAPVPVKGDDDQGDIETERDKP